MSFDQVLIESNGGGDLSRGLLTEKAMKYIDIPGAEQRAIMRGRARIAPKYSVEITLYDFDGVFQTEVIWDPYLPSPSKLRKLASKIDAVLEPFHTKVFEIAGPLEGEAS